MHCRPQVLCQVGAIPGFYIHDVVRLKIHTLVPVVFSWFWNTYIFTSCFSCFGILFPHTLSLVFGLHFCRLLPRKMHVFTKNTMHGIHFGLYMLLDGLLRVVLMFYPCFFMVLEHLHFTSCFACSGILFLHTLGLVFGLHFCRLLPRKIHLFTKHRKLRCMAYMWVFTWCFALVWTSFSSLPGLVAALCWSTSLQT